MRVLCHTYGTMMQLTGSSGQHGKVLAGGQVLCVGGVGMSFGKSVWCVVY